MSRLLAVAEDVARRHCKYPEPASMPVQGLSKPKTSKPVRCGRPTLGRFDSGAAPSNRIWRADGPREKPAQRGWVPDLAATNEADDGHHPSSRLDCPDPRTIQVGGRCAPRRRAAVILFLVGVFIHDVIGDTLLTATPRPPSSLATTRKRTARSGSPASSSSSPWPSSSGSSASSAQPCVTHLSMRVPARPRLGVSVPLGRATFPPFRS